MKKIMAVLLSLALLLGCAAAGAEDAGKQVFGTIRINGEYTFRGTLPEGYRFVPFDQSDESVLFRMLPEDPALPEMVVSIAFDETWADVKILNDADDAQLALLEKTFTDTDPYAVISYDETEYGTRLMLVRTTSGDQYDYLDIFSIYNGYFVEFIMRPGTGAAEQKLTDEDVAEGIRFLSDLDFVEGIEAEELKLAGNTFTANITGFDAEAKTLEVTLLTPWLLTEWQSLDIYEGKTVQLGPEEVLVNTLRYEEDDAIINEEYRLTRNEDNYFTLSFYDAPVLKEAKSLTLAVPDGVVFTEGIDPESGEMLEEAKDLGANELFAALAAAQNGGIGFDAQNIRVTFDEAGELARVDREYAPWQ